MTENNTELNDIIDELAAKGAVVVLTVVAETLEALAEATRQVVKTRGKTEKREKAPLLVVQAKNGVKLEVPADMEAYFAADKLTCPVVGCHWTGTVLPLHCNRAHRVYPAELQELFDIPPRSFCTDAYLEAQRERGKRTWKKQQAARS